jgi:hypothetical protein
VHVAERKLDVSRVDQNELNNCLAGNVGKIRAPSVHVWTTWWKSRKNRERIAHVINLTFRRLTHLCMTIHLYISIFMTIYLVESLLGPGIRGQLLQMYSNNE